MDCRIRVDKNQGKVYLQPTGKESILFNKILNIVDVSNFDRALEIYNVTQTEGFRKYNNSLVKQYRLDRSVVKTPLSVKGGFNEVISQDGSVRIVYKEGQRKVDLELIESSNRGGGLARNFLQDFIYSFPNKDIELIVSPRDVTTSFQGLATFYQSLGFEFKQNSSEEMVRFYNKGRLYPEGYDINAEPSVKHLMNFINLQGASTTTKKEVVSFLQSADISSSNDLLRQLSLAEKEGIFIFNKKSLENTKLFSTFEVKQILKSPAKQKSIVELLKYLRQAKEEIIVEPINKQNTEKVSAQGKIEVEEKETETTENLLIDNKVEPKKRRTNVKTVKTIEGNYNIELSENIAYVRRVPQESWDRLQTQIKTLLSSIESSASINGINLKGLTSNFNNLNRNQVLDILEATESVLEGTMNVYEFDSVLNTYLGDNFTTKDYILGEGEVLLDSELTEEEIFTNLNLVKVGKGVYKNVQDKSLLELLNINSIKNSKTIEEIEREVNKNYDRNIEDVETAKRIYLTKSNLDILDETNNLDTNKVSTYSETVPETFEQDFSDWLIENDNLLFTVDERGITFTDSTRVNEALESLPEYLKTDLIEYSKTSKNLTIDFVDSVNLELGMLNYDRAKVMANPNLIKEFEGIKVQVGNTVVVNNYTDNFLKSEGKIYELNEEIGNVYFFTELPTISVIDINILKPETELEIIDYSTMISNSTGVSLENVLTQKELNTINNQHFNC